MNQSSKRNQWWLGNQYLLIIFFYLIKYWLCTPMYIISNKILFKLAATMPNSISFPYSHHLFNQDCFKFCIHCNLFCTGIPGLRGFIAKIRFYSKLCKVQIFCANIFFTHIFKYFYTFIKILIHKKGFGLVSNVNDNQIWRYFDEK